MTPREVDRGSGGDEGRALSGEVTWNIPRSQWLGRDSTWRDEDAVRRSTAYE